MSLQFEDITNERTFLLVKPFYCYRHVFLSLEHATASTDT